MEVKDDKEPPEMGKQQHIMCPPEAETRIRSDDTGEPKEDNPFLSPDMSEVSTNRSLVVDVLAIFFGIGTWLGVNAIFLQLPLLVEKAPEHWSLPSYLSFVVQIGNVGPLFYTFLQKISSDRINESKVIYLLLGIGNVSAILAAFFFDRTATIGGKEYSVALFVFTFCFALTACTSSVLFMPYMGRFKEIYLVTYLFGEGLSGLLPSVVALIQGVGGSTVCIQNETESGTVWEKSKSIQRPLFGIMEFFIIIFVIMIFSCFGFIFLDCFKLAKKHYANVTVMAGNSYVYKKDNGKADLVEELPEISPFQYKLLMWFTIVKSFFANGMFTSIQSYSTLPYGSQTYHLTATLSLIANPVACFLAVFLPHTGLKSIISLTGISVVLTIYVFVTAVMSPNPPFAGSSWGSAIVISVWTLLIGIISYTKLSITSVMRAQGGKSLVWTGSLSLIGSAAGSVLIFIVINYTSIFRSYKKACG